MSFDADEKSIAQSRPREAFLITHGATTYRIATGDRDITIGGQTFVASPSARTEPTLDQATATIDFAIVLPATHPLVRRYTSAGGTPPKQINVSVYRLQLQSGEYEAVWAGQITSAAFKGHTVSFRVAQRSQRLLQKQIPMARVDRTCQAVLYDKWCQADPTSFTVSTTITMLDGAHVTVAGMSGNPDQWARGGVLIDVASGESMTILDQTGDVLTLQAAIGETRPGGAVKVIAGCDHTIATCANKFANQVNFVGCPQLPTVNPFVPGSLGVDTQK